MGAERPIGSVGEKVGQLRPRAEPTGWKVEDNKYPSACRDLGNLLYEKWKLFFHSIKAQRYTRQGKHNMAPMLSSGPLSGIPWLQVSETQDVFLY